MVSEFRGLVHCHHDRKHDGMQTDMVLERQLRVLYLDPLGRDSEPLDQTWASETSKSSDTAPPQDHTYFNEATPSNRGPPHEPMKAIFFSTTTLGDIKSKQMLLRTHTILVLHLYQIKRLEFIIWEVLLSSSATWVSDQIHYWSYASLHNTAYKTWTKLFWLWSQIFK